MKDKLEQFSSRLHDGYSVKNSFILCFLKIKICRVPNCLN